MIALEKPRLPQSLTAFNVTALRAAWKELKNVHDFHLLLRRFDVGRERAFQLVGPPFAREVGRSAHRRLGELVQGRGQEVMLFLSNPGCVQIHTGLLQRIEVMGPWWNVLDPRFNLHLREDLVARTWVVHKPTELGGATSLELFDEGGRLILYVFGKREKGQPESAAWRALLDQIAADEAVGWPAGRSRSRRR